MHELRTLAAALLAAGALALTGCATGGAGDTGGVVDDGDAAMAPTDASLSRDARVARDSAMAPDAMTMASDAPVITPPDDSGDLDASQGDDAGTDAAQATDASPRDAGVDSGPPGCQTNANCTSPKVCNTTTHACVACVANTDCTAPTSKCDTSNDTCVACLLDGDCAAGNVCKQHACTQGCSATQACPSGQVCNVAAGACAQCLADSNCAAPNPRCDTTTDTCVACLPTNDNCPTGNYCISTACAPGCRTSADCVGSPSGPVCNTPNHQCVQCLADGDCALGEVCNGMLCVGGCDATHGCPNGESCCTSVCSGTVTNCTGCGLACDTTHSLSPSCNAAGCSYGSCAAGFGDCNTTAPDLDGCETAVNTTTNCGGCGDRCTLTNASGAACTGTCSYTCNAGSSDCNKGTPPDTDGCECATPSCCGSGCQTTHIDGLGQSFFDCNPLGTHTDPSAIEACTAYALSIGGSAADCTDAWGCTANPSLAEVCYGTAGSCTKFCWAYGGSPGIVTACSDCTTTVASWD